MPSHAFCPASQVDGWFCHTFGWETEPLPFDDEDEDADLRVGADESAEDVLAFYGRARAAADEVIAEVPLDETGTAWFGKPVSMRWVLIHMVEETARHAGHDVTDGPALVRRPGSRTSPGSSAWRVGCRVMRSPLRWLS
ncbi:MAG: DUF664 domain-containing protein, partial [Acidimicrobiales bacterium]